MNKPTYQVEILEHNSFYFLSVGTKGIIVKMVEIAEIEKNIYNLGFGDYDFATKSVNDSISSNNGDAEKVLATVFMILLRFLNENPEKSIFISGSNTIRTRLYQMIINNYFEEFSQDLIIYGGVEDRFEPFIKNQKYESFLVKKRF